MFLYKTGIKLYPFLTFFFLLSLPLGFIPSISLAQSLTPNTNPPNTEVIDLTRLRQVVNIENWLHLGRTRKALTLTEKLLQNDPNDPQLLGLLALVKVSQGELSESISLYQKALQFSQEPHDRLVNLNNYRQALKYQERFLSQQIQFLELDGKRQKLAATEQLLSHNQDSQAQIAQAIAETIPQVVPNQTVAWAYLHLNQPLKAQEALLKDFPSPKLVPLYLEIAQRLDNPVPLLTHGLKSADLKGKVRLYTALAQHDPSFLLDAIKLAQQAQFHESLLELYHRQAQLGISPKRSLKLAVNSASRLRTQLTSPHPEATFFFQEKIVPLYRAYLTELLNNPRQDDLKEARIIFDRLQIAQVENLFKQLCITRPVDIDAVLAQKQAGLIQIIVLENAYHVLLTLPNGEIKHHSLNTPATEIATTLLQWRTALQNSHHWDFQNTAQQLYRDIIAPYETEIQSLDELFVIGDQYFRSVPLGALVDGQEYLIEKIPLNTLLSWNLLVNRPFSPGSFLGFGLGQPRPPFPNPIPYAEVEVQALSEIVPNSVVYIGSDFTKESLRQELLLKDPQVLHLASHALFTGDPKQSVLTTFDGTISMLELPQYLRLPTSLRLFVLSACETSQGNNLATLGLAGVAARGGVETILGTLWQANDQFSVNFMLNFYQALSNHRHPAMALQNAQIEAIQQGLHPAFWSLFLLIGS